MKKFSLSFSRIFLVVAILFQNFFPFGLHFSALPSLSIDSDYVEAGLIVNNNLGYADISFSNQVGVVSSTGIKISGGTAKLLSGFLAGEIIMSDIEPISISGWSLMTMNGSIPSTTSLTTTLLECSGSTPISGFIDRGLPLSLSSLDKTTYPCVKAKYTLSRNAITDPSPFIQSSRISFQSVSVLQVSIANQPSTTACSPISYTVNVANNYIDNTGPVIVYVPKPSGSLISGYTSSYNQFPGYEPTFSKASDSGMYTTVGVPALGVPADSIYRSLPSMKAGDTKQVTMTLYTPCGTQSGTMYALQAYADSSQSALTSGNIIQTKVSSAPAPDHILGLGGTFILNNQHRVYSLGNTTVSYIDQLFNRYQATEHIFNPSLTVDFTDIINGLQTKCGVGSPALAQSRISGLIGGTRSGTNYIWDKTSLGAGAGQWIGIGGVVPRVYSIDYANCNGSGDTFTITSTFDGDNIAPLTLIQPVRILTHLESSGGFSKRGPLTIYQGDSYQYSLSLTNRGTLAYSGYHIEDALPSGLQLLGISLNNGGFSGLSYTLGTGASGNLIIDVYGCINPPYLTPTSGPCLGAPTSASINLQVKDIQPLSCSDYSINNTADFGWKQVATDPSATVFADTNVTGSFVSDARNVTARTNAPSLSIQSSGPTSLSVGDIGSYSYTISNNGRANSTATTMTLSLPEVMINGVTGYISINTVVGATANYTNQQSGLVTLSLGTLTPGQSKTITFLTIPVPVGILNNTVTSLHTSTIGNSSCGPVSAVSTSPLTLDGQNQMRISKYKNFSLILQTGYLEYQMPITNVGEVAVNNAYVVDILPAHTEFVQAYTNYTTPYYTYSCNNCRVYFAASDPSLPSTISVTSHFTKSMIQSKFVIGTEVSPGVRNSPFGSATKYVAFAVDDSNGIFPVNLTKTPGLQIKDIDTPIGGLISNKAEVLADGLLPAITTPVQTTVFGTPGLRIGLASDVDIVAACEPFNRTLNYTHDGSNPNTKTVITTFFPDTSLLLTGVGIYHTFNNLAVTQGAIGGTYDVTPSSAFQLLHVTSGTVVSFDVSEYLSGMLQPGWGGTLQFAMNANCANPTNTIMEATAQGEYENEVSQGTVSAEDPVNVANADLWIQKEADQSRPLPGEMVNYTLTLQNKGPHFASGVILSDLLPIGMCYVSGSTHVSTPGWSLGEPVLSGSCGGGNQQQLIWTMDDMNTIGSSSYPLGYIPGNSPAIFINYQANVVSALSAGTSLVNGASTATSTVEDPVYPNDSSKEVIIPYPDPTLTVQQPVTTTQGDIFPVTIKYTNNNRMCTNSGYVIATLPNYTAGGYTSTQVASVSANASQEIYYHTCPYGFSEPVFDYDLPLSNGWTSSAGSSVCYIAIKHTQPLCDTDGQQQSLISLVATNPDGSTLSPGTVLTSSATIYGLDDSNMNNNTGSASTSIPSLDLYATISGSIEGGYPGTVPSADQTYLVTFGLQGTQSSCDNYIDVTLSSGLVLKSPVWHDFDTLLLTDSSGTPLSPVDIFSVPISSLVPITSSSSLNGSGDTVVRFTLGSPASSVCLPAGARGSFHVFTTLREDLADSTSVESSVTIGENSAGIEDTLMNNTDSTQVTAYRADLMIQKSAISDNNGDGYFDAVDSTTMTDQNKKIRYKLEYDNIGNASASGAVINEKIPSQTCYVIGSLESNIPAGTVIEYSADSGVNYTYTPIGTTGLQDCFVTDWRLKWLTELPAPAHLASDQASNRSPLQNLSVGYDGGQAALLLGTTGNWSLGQVSQEVPNISPLFSVDFATGDLDGDGDLDIIGVGGYNQSYIYINNGSGIFTGMVLPGGYLAFQSIAVGDLDGDGDLDLAGAGNGGNSAIYINDGLGSFTAWALSGGANFFTKFSLGDLDGDGDLDLAGTSSGGPSIIFLNDGSGTSFNAQQLPGGSTSFIAGFNVVDLDGDGDLDLAATTVGGSNQVYLNNGGGSFTNSILPGGGRSYDKFSVKDFDNDGDFDLAIANGGNLNSFVYFNNGSGSFTQYTLPGGTIIGESKFTVADYDNDGDLDLASAVDYGYFASRIYRNNGGGTFTTYFLSGGTTNFKGKFVTSDFDNDGDLDLMGGGYGGDSRIYRNNGGGTFTTFILPGGSTQFMSLSTGDLDNDGDTDIIAASYGSTSKIYRNNGGGSFTSYTLPGGDTQLYNLVVSDLDNDGYLDLSSAGTNKVYLNNANGTFRDTYPGPGSTDFGNNFAFTEGDLDGDGDLDLVGAKYGYGSSIYLSNGDGTFTTHDNLDGGSYYQSPLAIADFDGDGDLDLAGASAASWSPSKIYINDGAGNFVTNTNSLPPNSTFRAKFNVADFDGDGDLDLAGAANGGDSKIYYNDGSGIFTDYSLPGGPTSFNSSYMTINFDDNGNFTVADLDGDGDLDLAGASDNDDSKIYINNGASNFTVSVLPGGTTRFFGGFATGDFDGDGDLDLAGAGFFGNASKIYRNNGGGSFSESVLPGAGQFDSRFNVADLDGDGDLDLAGAADSGPSIIYRNNGGGSFSSSTLPGGGGLGYGFNIVDLDGDGDQDLAGAAWNGSHRVYKNNGSGSFTYYPLPGGNSAVGRFNVVDFDNDGDQDLALFTNGSSKIYINQGGFLFSPYSLPSTAISPHGKFSVADFDGDGDQDLAGADANFNTSRVYLNNFLQYTTGSYTTILFATGRLSARNKLLTNQVTIPGSNSLTYTIYPVLGGICDTGSAALVGPSELSAPLDISSIDPIQTSICVQVDFAILTGTVSPVLKSLVASYYSPDRASVSFDVQVTTGTLISQTIPNTARISTITPETDLSNNESNYEMTIRGTDLSVIKTVDLGAAHAGDTVTYTISYKNEGPQDAYNVRIEDILPEGVNYLGSSIYMYPTLSGYQTDLYTVPVGGSGSFTITAQIPGTALDGDIFTNTARIFSDTAELNYDNNESSATSIIGDIANVYTIIDTPSTYSLNHLFPFSIWYGNNGNLAADNTVVRIDLPADMSYDSQVSGPACMYILVGNYIECTIGTLAPGVRTQLDFLARAGSNLGLLTGGSALVFTSSITTTTLETNTIDNTSEDQAIPTLGDASNIHGMVYLDSQSNMMYDTGDRYNAGESILLAGVDIFGTVYGPDPSLYPVEYQDMIVTRGLSGSGYVIVPPSVTDNGGNYYFLGLNPGTYATHFVIQPGAIALSSTGGYLTSGSKLGQGSLDNGTISPLDITDIILGEGEYTRQNTFGLTLPTLINVATTIHASVLSDTGINLTVSYANTTSQITPNTQLVVLLGTGVDYVGDDFGGVYNPTDHSVTFALGTLPPTTGGSIVIQTLIQSGMILVPNQQILFDTAISTAGSEITYTDNLDRDSVYLSPTNPLIDIVKQTSTPFINAGDTAQYTISVTNIGGVDLHTVSISDPLVPGCDLLIGDLLVGQNQSYTCSLTNVTADITNIATAQGTTSGGTTVSDTDSVLVTVNGGGGGGTPSLDIVKTTSTPTVTPGQDAYYYISVTNNGTENLFNISVSDGIAPGCNAFIGDLTVGQSTGYSCVLPSIASDTYNSATAQGTTSGGTTVNDTDGVWVIVNGGGGSIADVMVRKTVVQPLALHPGDFITYSIYYENIGTDTAHNTFIIDTPLTGLTLLGATFSPDYPGTYFQEIFTGAQYGIVGDSCYDNMVASTQGHYVDSLNAWAPIETGLPDFLTVLQNFAGYTGSSDRGAWRGSNAASIVGESDFYTAMNNGLDLDLSAIAPSCGVGGHQTYRLWIDDHLIPGSGGYIYITGQVATTGFDVGQTGIRNAVEITTSSTETDLSNNRSSVFVPFVQDVDLYVTKTILSPLPLTSGSYISYLISYGNLGTDMSVNTILTDLPGNGLDILSSSVPYTTVFTGVVYGVAGDDCYDDMISSTQGHYVDTLNARAPMATGLPDFLTVLQTYAGYTGGPHRGAYRGANAASIVGESDFYSAMNNELGIDLSTIDPSCGTPGETQYHFSISSTLAPGAHGQVWITGQIVSSELTMGQTGIWNTVRIGTSLFEDNTGNNTDRVFAPFMTSTTTGSTPSSTGGTGGGGGGGGGCSVNCIPPQTTGSTFTGKFPIFTGVFNAPPLRKKVKLTPLPEEYYYIPPIVPKTGPDEDESLAHYPLSRSDIADMIASDDSAISLLSKDIFRRTSQRLGYTPKISAGYVVIPKYGVVIPLQKQLNDMSYKLSKLSYEKIQLTLSAIEPGEIIRLYDRDNQKKSFVMSQYRLSLDDDSARTSSLSFQYEEYLTQLGLDKLSSL